MTGLALVINLLQHAQVPFRLLYFTYTLSLSASLMYACSELTGNPNPDDMKALQELKSYLIANVLPWLPLAIDFISLGKRKRRFDIMESIHSNSGSTTSPPSTTTPAKSTNPLTHHRETSSNSGSVENKRSGKKSLPSNTQAILQRMYRSSSFPETKCNLIPEDADCSVCRDSHFDVWSFLHVECNLESYDDETAITGEVSSLVIISSGNQLQAESKGDDDHDYVPTASEQCELTAIEALKSSLPPSSMYHRQIIHKHNRSSDRSNLTDSVYNSKSMEFLTVKTIDALYAFLCMDDMYPLSTYLRYTHLFDQCHVIASVSYFMSEQHGNPLVLKRGLDLLRYFADHQMQLSIIAMHSPPALIAVVRLMQDSLEAQLSFAKIILAINRADDDFARENLLRFRIHQVLMELMLRESNLELVRTCVQALLALAATEAHIREIARIELPASLAPCKPASSAGGSNGKVPVTLIGTGPLVASESNGNASVGTSTGQKTIVRRGSGLPTPSDSSSTCANSDGLMKPRSPSSPPLPAQTTSPHELSNHSGPDAATSQHDAEIIADEATGILLFPAGQRSIPFAIIPKSSSSSGPMTRASVPSMTTAYGTAANSIANTINIIDVLLYVLETQTKELRTHYYALRLLVLVESLFKQGVHQVLRKSNLAGAIKKSKKMLKKVYIDDASAAAPGVDTNTSASQGGSGLSKHGMYAGLAHNQRNLSADNSAASGKGEDVEKRDVEILLNEAIIKNDRCVIS
jgi:hypothetical protein